MGNLLLFNKPFHVLCQFTDNSPHAHHRKTLADYIQYKDFYPAGRLDYDSEGLLLLTNNGKLQHKISDPKFKLPKTYLVQVEGEITSEAIQQLQNGVTLKDGLTQPTQAHKTFPPPWLWERTPPIRQRKHIPTSWIQLTLTEGKNRQVRRMTAAVGFPTLRLIRIKIGKWHVNRLPLGQSQLLHVPKL